MKPRTHHISLIAIACTGALLASAQARAADCSPDALPCLKPSQSQAEALFSRIELKYPQFFSPASVTQLTTIGTDLVYFRSYAQPSTPGLATFQGGLWYSVDSKWYRFSSLDEGNRDFCDNACWTSSSNTKALFPVVDTGQFKSFGEMGTIEAPTAGLPFYGQDAQFAGTQPSYTKSSDGLTIKDNVTGLTWQKSPDTNGDGVIDSLDKLTLAQAQTHITTLSAANYGGYNDWRLPTIKELYSLITFTGIDPSGYTGTDTSVLSPFIDRTYFDFAYGATTNGGRIIDMNYASSTSYVYHTMASSPAQFGVNFADGRIKGYSLDMSWSGPGVSVFPIQLVRGTVYGANDFVDNSDSSITDRATKLMWTKGDSAKGLNWQEALAWAQAKNAENYLGHSDWRLPNAKELQGIVDYTRSPDTTSSAAISPLFTCTGITNEAGKADFPFYWTSTTHTSVAGSNASAVSGGYAVYVAFGRAMGYMTGGDPRVAGWLDVHGAGAQRSDPKVGNPADYPKGHGPQGDAIRIYNYVRLVRNVSL